jgi:hypothetical protein
MRRTAIAILAVIGTAALALGLMIWDDERIKKHNLAAAVLASPLPSSAAAAAGEDDPRLLVLLKTQPPELNGIQLLVIPFTVTNTSPTFMKVVWVECAALDNETLIDSSAAVVPNIKQNETAYGYVLFTKTKDLKLHFKCRISQVLD